MTDIPQIATERLVLRGYRLEDFDAFAAFYATARSAFAGGPRDLREAWRHFAADLGHWAMMGFGWWMVTENGRPVGTVGMHRPPFCDDIELGWTLFDGATGRGLATEAARAALRWAVATLAPERLISHIDPRNAASVRLAERLGARRHEGRAAHDPDACIYLHDLKGFRS
ncbi:GNAT family N-acetyltransferase [Aestuariicoccus sp. MJ-SS9]|uniref:GNAT family N-acetyltransferase n=1 Tax=Aestuariicoccus sp. MJ-SS9 TaxID=3079855 RepID=UPI00290AE755|nr:GNAT family N-acetyltransferase [Aestuariicoccus sp. MJ-SS9]MDU8912940.1 GNAT family N-acetyltransferase [Aestuariicoccus sp. MJ-SS9]